MSPNKPRCSKNVNKTVTSKNIITTEMLFCNNEVSDWLKKVTFQF